MSSAVRTPWLEVRPEQDIPMRKLFTFAPIQRPFMSCSIELSVVAENPTCWMIVAVRSSSDFVIEHFCHSCIE